MTKERSLSSISLLQLFQSRNKTIKPLHESQKQNWQSLMRNGILKEHDSGQYLYKGSFKTHQLVEVYWKFHHVGMCLIILLPDGRNSKLFIPYEQILHLSFGNGKRDSSVNDSENGSSQLQTTNCLFLIYIVKYKESQVLSLCFIPQFGTLVDFKALKSIWLRHQLQDQQNYNDLEEIQILWQGFTQQQGVDFAWLMTKRYLVFCFSSDMPQMIYYYQIHHLFLDQNQLLIYYSTLSQNEQIRNHSLTIPNFQSDSFEQLSLYWRHELQLKYIQHAFDDASSPEKRLMHHILQMETQPKPEMSVERELKRKDSAEVVGLKRADSMRRLFMRKSRSSAVIRESRLFTSFDPNNEIVKETVSETEETKEVGEEEQQQPVIEPELETCSNDQQSASDSEAAVSALESDKENLNYTDQRFSLIQRRNRSNSSPVSLLNWQDYRMIKKRSNTDFDSSRPTTPLFNAPRAYDQTPVPSEKDLDLYQSCYTYKAEGPGELSMKLKDLFHIEKKDPSGWWFAFRLGYTHEDVREWVVLEEGWVPSNFLKPLPLPNNE